MFTGLVEEIGEIVAVDRGAEITRFTIRAPRTATGLRAGDSVATGGVCLTVTRPGASEYDVEAMPQTLAVTTAGAWQAGDAVNLERALAADARLGGHIVQGHVDHTARVLAATDGEQWRVLRLALPPAAAGLVVDKGSICVDGTSLTVSAVSDPDAREPWFEVSLIPATLAATTLGAAVVGTVVNVETDVLARQVQRLLAFAEVGR